MEWYSLLSYSLFLVQILLISYYLPKRMLARVRSVLKDHPPSEYPKLYPRSIEYYRSGHRVFQLLNWGILLLGFGILVALLTVVDHRSFADDGFISEAWPGVYGILQCLPFVVLEVAACSQFKLMRANNVSTRRKAQLRPRRFLSLVPRGLLVAAVVSFFVMVGVDLYLHDFVVDWGHDTLQRAATLTFANLFMVVLGLWQFYGRKQDPYQAYADRDRQTTAQWTSILATSVTMSLFFLSTAVDDVFAIDYLDAPLMSLYFIVIVVLSLGSMMRSLRLEETDFEVYRAGPSEKLENRVDRDLGLGSVSGSVR